MNRDHIKEHLQFAAELGVAGAAVAVPGTSLARA
jgi:hypothetical protein